VQSHFVVFTQECVLFLYVTILHINISDSFINFYISFKFTCLCVVNLFLKLFSYSVCYVNADDVDNYERLFWKNIFTSHCTLFCYFWIMAILDPIPELNWCILKLIYLMIFNKLLKY
jgi:hypothetical protein